MMREFVEGWNLVQVLGEGAYGEVQLLVNTKTQEAVAVKQLDITREPNASKNIEKEIFIHRLMKHENIIKYYGHRKETPLHYIFLEYASGGELFDRIEPDIGMPIYKAKKYFLQIISAVEYIHSLGIAHRDLKPENILLDKNDTVKISDFGLATIFRHKGQERILARRCGTLPYLAPEIFHASYRAEPADIWSCGILLVIMLGGELPWDEATLDCDLYSSWVNGEYSVSPWTKVDTLALALLKKILIHSPSKRYKIKEIKDHLWCKKPLTLRNDIKPNNDPIPSKRLCSDLDHSDLIKEENISKVSSSQPVPVIKGSDIIDILSGNLNEQTIGVSFTQPINPENMMLSSQFSATPGRSQSPFQSLVKRLTRFCVKMDCTAIVEELKISFEKLGYSWKKSGVGQVTVTTQDKRKTQLVFKTTLIEMHNNILVDFRLSKGDGLEFKRHFLKIKNLLSHIIDNQPVIGIYPELAN